MPTAYKQKTASTLELTLAASIKQKKHSSDALRELWHLTKAACL
jgi:hypothetical protein